MLADSPEAYWRLDETSGTTANDSSGNGLNGTLAGGVMLGAVGGLTSDTDAAMSFDGSTGYVSLPSGFSDFTGGLTIEAWIYPTSTGSWARVVDLGNGPASDNVFLARVGTTSDLTFGVSIGSSSALGTTASNVLVLNTWQYVAATMDSAGKTTMPIILLTPLSVHLGRAGRTTTIHESLTTRAGTPR